LKSILIISPSLKTGGIERALTVLANEFVACKFQVFFIACLPGAQQYALDERIKTIPSGIHYGRGPWGKLLFYMRLVIFLRRQTQSIKPDAVLTFGDVFNPLVLLALIGKNINVYISDRTSPSFRINPVARMLKRWLYPGCAGFIAQTSRMADFQRRAFGARLNIRTIPNAISLIDLRVPARRNSVLYVGRLSWEKGVDRLIRAMALVADKNWKLEIVGSGPEQNKLESLAAELGISDRTLFHGQQRTPEHFFAACSIFVLPSHMEGFPNALCEAMSAEMPCICFDSIPFESILEPDVTGLVVSKDNIQELADKLNYLIRDDVKRTQMGRLAAQTAKKFDSRKIALEYLEFMNLRDRCIG
jgi:GalNAc-alpha-(1->4)-GalNAc-alpha-(1->3)-diNAcBac-PP-undecaprenol alpha-1,4-N-acetyl-D-galactosaminyltransferase